MPELPHLLYVRARLNVGDDQKMAKVYPGLGGCRAVEQAARPMDINVRDHMRVRNRHSERCPRCGTTIRREGVRGYVDSFRPSCRRPSRTVFLDRRNTPGR
jgi:hypothetical protein